MSRTTIPLTGIQRNLPDGVAPDGACQEIINFRPKDGAWRVLGNKSQEKSSITSTYKYMAHHNISPTRKAWWVLNTSGTNVMYFLEDEDGTALDSNTSFDTYTGSYTSIRFSFLGNAVIMHNDTAETIDIYLFDAELGTYGQYRNIGSLPDPLHATIQTASDGSDSATWAGTSSTLTDSERLGGDAAIASEIATLKESGYWHGKIFFMWAFELYDGSIVKPSAVVRATGVEFADAAWGGVVWASTYTKQLANFQCKLTSGAVTTLQSTYQGIIKGVNIYASSTNDNAQLDPNDSASAIEVISDDKTLEGVDGFYLVRKIALEDIQSGVDVDIMDGQDITSIELNNPMPVDNNTCHTVYSPRGFTYNERIFLPQIKNTLYDGYYADAFNPTEQGSGSGPTGTFYIMVEVTIDTEHGQKIVRPGVSSIFTWTGNQVLIPCFTYPDTRASKVKVILQSTSGPTIYYYYQEVALTPHKHFNFAYAEDFEIDVDNSTTLATESKSYWDYNRVQATERMNPFFLPAVNSYRVSQSTVLTLATNAVAIDTSQFGEYPIYAFTEDGVWTMQIGSGDVLVQSVKPLSRHVCNNADGVVMIDGGVVFPTGKGLFIVSGAQFVEISQKAEGDHTSQISSKSDLTTLIGTTTADDLVCNESLLDYLDDAVIGYDYIENEILVSKSSENYTWVYNVDNAIWYKRQQVWDRFISHFPKMYGMNDTNNDVEDLTVESDATDDMVLYIETRPLTFGVSGLKKIMRMLIECKLQAIGYTSTHLQLWGSADGVNYNLLFQDSKGYGEIDHFMIGRTVYSCEYFILVLTGKDQVYDGLIRNIVTDVTQRFSVKLRRDI